jgi:hypothetical protein
MSGKVSPPVASAPLQRGRQTRRNAGLTYRPVGVPGGPYPEWVRALRGKSGAYVIRERSARGEAQIVYVGQSQADRLYETLTRHFQGWSRHKRYWRGQFSANDPGTTYPRADVEVAVRVTDASHALEEEARLIRRLQPRDNVLGQPDDDDLPF